MDDRSRHILRRQSLLRRWTARLVIAGLPLCIAAYPDGNMLAPLSAAPPAVIEKAVQTTKSAGSEEQAAEPNESREGTPHGSPPLSSSPNGEEGREALNQRELVISIDTVLRLAGDQNTQIALARARVDEACAERELAGKRWLPDLYLGTGYYRHEGGIQNPDGTFIRSSFGGNPTGLDLNAKIDPKEIMFQQVSAERKAWQQKGELSKVANETLLDAAGTYIDLLTARSGEAVAREMLKDLEDLLPETEKRARNEPAAEVEVSRVKAEIQGRKQNIRHIQAQAAGASAKLVYLLGVEPCVLLVPGDKELIAFDLVDVSPPVCDLVAKAIANGPGIHELEAMVSLVEDAIHKAKGPGRFLPTFEMCMGEGLFGAGPNNSITYANRFDALVGVRWNLTDIALRPQRLKIADAQRQQAHIAFNDLQAKLTAGVQEARESIVSSAEEIQITREQIEYANKAKTESKKRLEKNLAGSSATEVLLSMQSLAMAQIAHINAIRDLDKAQLRLMLLVGCRK